MFAEWLRANRSAVATATSTVVVAALVVTFAVVSDGYTAQRYDLDDGSVWVANGADQAIGRANTEVLELNSIVPASSADIDVLQNGRDVLLFDRGDSTLDVIDPALATIGDSVPMPPDRPELHLAGSKIVILEQGTGEAWIEDVASLSTFDAESASSLSLGADSLVDADESGRIVAYTPSTRRVLVADAATDGTVVESATIGTAARDSAFQITTVSGTWAVLDTDQKRLHLPGITVDLTEELADGPVAIERASATGERVLIADTAGVLAVSLDGRSLDRLSSGSHSTPARPVELGECAFAAWADGTAWRSCTGSSVDLPLAGMTGAPSLEFEWSGERIVLNDSRSGASWAVQSSGERIDNWSELLPQDDDTEQPEQNDTEDPPVVDPNQQPPVAIDDEFGARPDRATVVPVLLNDYDPNGDVLAIDSVSAIDPAIGTLDLISNRQQVQLTLAPGVSGTVRFDYTVSDGRGGEATASATVAIKQAAEDSPPVQVRESTAIMQTGGRVQAQVLGDWVDPDGDAIYLASAIVAAPERVSFKPQGTVIVSDSGGGSAVTSIALQVSDGTSTQAGTLQVMVYPSGQVPLVAEPFVALAYAGQEITIAPLEHVRGGSGTVRLNSVPAKTGVQVTASYEAGTFRFESDQARTHYLEYVVTDGDQSVTGLVRVDVQAPPAANTKPITVPKTVFVKSLSNERIDVAGTDIDPSGGVLLVTAIDDLAPGSGVRAEILEQRLVRVSLEAPLDSGPVVFTYRVSNGLAEAVGVITVIEIPTPARLQPPIANDDIVSVRAGQIVDIAVLDNDEHPDGAEFTLVPKLVQGLPDDSGLLFASGKRLRYLAPDKTGNFTAVYEIEGPDGQRASASVRIAVREADPASNNAPVPLTVTARVLAGQAVRIPIPLAAIDPDGDAVQLIGQSTSPQKGQVASSDSESFSYLAGEYSTGTDTFTYSVIDALGARATGIVRIGITPRLEGARNPVATLDIVRVRPGTTVSVEVLANDSDPDGSALTVVSAIPNDDVTTAEIEGDIVRVTPPEEPGTYGVIYSIENEFGGSSQNFIRVVVDPEAPLSYPVARDSVLALSDILGRTTVTVDVLANVFFADGDVRDLGLAIYPGFGGAAQVTAAKRVTVTVEDESQIIPFVVRHPADESIATYGFIRVPGLDDALPQIDRRAAPLSVESESILRIELNDYVIAVGGKQVRLTDSSTVSATNADGSKLVVDDDTLEFRSADKYFGPASISFEVTDGSSATDPDGRRAIIVLPITVTPRENQPPVFTGAVLDFEPGQERTLDLLRLTTYPYPDDLDELAFDVLDPLPVDFTWELTGSQLTIRADADAVKGATTSMAIGVADDLAEGRSGRIQLAIVPSTRPLLQPAPDVAVLPRGSSATIDVLANDAATNPFPGEPLSVVAIRGIDGSNLPDGVSVTASADRRTVSVSVSQTAVAADVTFQYQVADSTGDRDRLVWGTVTISVQDRPDPVANLLPIGFADQTITMRWSAGSFNNAPITNYRVTVTSLSGVVLSTKDCKTTTCDVATPGNGPSNQIRVTVVAQNSIGDSDPTVTSTGIWSDIIPPAPGFVTSVALDHALRLTWQSVSTPSGGSPVDRYHVVVGANSADVDPGVCSAGSCTWQTPSSWNLANGVPVTFTVSPRNAAYTALSVWNTSQPQSDVPAGPPLVVASPVASVAGDTAILLDWTGTFDPNGTQITSYLPVAYTATTPSCANPSPSGASAGVESTATTQVFSGLAPNASYSFVVLATNAQGCATSSPVIGYTPPGVVNSLSKSGPLSNGQTFDFTLTGGAIGFTPLTSDYTLLYRLSGPTVPSTAYGPIAFGDFLTAEGRQYGQPLAVSVRACRNYGSVAVCQSQWSSNFALGTAVDPRVGGLAFSPDAGPASNDGTFEWLDWPTGSYEGIAYSCGDGVADPFVIADTSAPGSCTTTDVSKSEDPRLVIRVIANGGSTYDIVYTN